MGMGKQGTSGVRRIKAKAMLNSIVDILQTGRPLVVKRDASKYVCSGIVSQHDEDGKFRPIAYRSKAMAPAECNYDVHDKKLLAIVQALKEWRGYLR